MSKLRDDFPGFTALDAAGEATHAKVRKRIADGTLQEIEGIGPATEDQIIATFKEIDTADEQAQDERDGANAKTNDHDEIKSELATDAKEPPARSAAELEIDRKVEEQTARQAETRRQLEETELRRKRDDFTQNEKSLHIRALDASLGLVEHLGCRGVYVGKSPQSEEGKSACPSCLQPLAGGNSKFTPLPYVIPVAGMLVKDAGTGEFFALPSDGTLTDARAETWLTIINPSTDEPFVPAASTKGSQDRARAAGLV